MPICLNICLKPCLGLSSRGVGLNQAALWPQQLCVENSFVVGTKCHRGGVPSKGRRIFVVFYTEVMSAKVMV